METVSSSEPNIDNVRNKISLRKDIMMDYHQIIIIISVCRLKRFKTISVLRMDI